MNKIIRDFKHHYHKIRKLMPGIVDQGAISFTVNLYEGKLSSSTSIPSPEISIKFPVLMRRFLAPQYDLYYEKVLAFVQENAPQVLTSEKLTKINTYINSLKRGLISIQINDKQFTAEEIYSLVSEGEFFQNDERVSNYLQEISSFPIVGPLFWHQFYSYTLDGFSVISILFDLILEWQKSENENKEITGKKLAKCIYCLRTDNSFRSEEHIFPEGLGNDEAVLPKGYVCDSCNNGMLAVLDSYLIEFEPIAFFIVQYVSYTKSGNLPKANFQNMKIEKTRPGHITITAKDKSGGMFNKKELGNNWFSWDMNFKGKPMNPTLLGRSLYKIGLGFIAFDQGHEAALSKRFDPVRDFINGKTNFPNNLLVSTKVQPHPNLKVTFKDMVTGCPFEIDIFGIIFIFNLEEVPIIEPNTQLIEQGFQKFSLAKI